MLRAILFEVILRGEEGLEQQHISCCPVVVQQSVSVSHVEDEG